MKMAERKEHQLIKRKQKHVWTKEDERILIRIQDHLREYYVDKKGYPYVAESDSPEMIEFNWLKSLKERLQHFRRCFRAKLLRIR